MMILIVKILSIQITLFKLQNSEAVLRMPMRNLCRFQNFSVTGKCKKKNVDDFNKVSVINSFLSIILNTVISHVLVNIQKRI